MKKYFEYLRRMNLSQLKFFLGNDIQEELMKWTSDKEDPYSKEKVISILDSLNGIKLFEQVEFRKQLLLHGSEKEIKIIQQRFLTGNEKAEQNLQKVAECIAHKPWNKDELSNYLMTLWGLDNSIFDKEKIITETSFSITPNDRFFELLDYQNIIKEKANYLLASGKILPRLLIQMPTGTGKTKTAMHIIVQHYIFSLKNNGLVIWIAHTKELLEQAEDTFKNVWSHLGNQEITCYRLYDGNDLSSLPETLEGIAFCSIQTLQSIFKSKTNLLNRIKQDVRLIVFDEAHKALAAESKKVIEELMRLPDDSKNRALVGLTATPGRTTDESDENYKLSNMFDRNVITIEPELINKMKMGHSDSLNSNPDKNIIKYFQDRKILSKINVETLKYKQSFSESELEKLKSVISSNDNDFTKEQIEMFAKDRSRNDKILNRLFELNNTNIPTIVFACSVSHAKLLSAMLTLLDIPNVVVHGELSKEERGKNIQLFKDKNNKTNIIINYGVLTTGFDSKNIQCVFITRPTKSIVLYSQMIGRGLRGPQMGGNEECLLIDIEDNVNSFNYELAFSHFDNYWQ